MAAGTKVHCPMCQHELLIPGSSSRSRRSPRTERVDRHEHHQPEFRHDHHQAEYRDAETNPLQRELAGANLLTERLERELETAQGELKVLRQERDRAAAAQAQTSAELKRLQAENAAASAQWAAEFKRLQTENAATLSQVSAELQRLRTENAAALAEWERTDIEATALREEVAGLETARSEAAHAAAQAIRKMDAAVAEKAAIEETFEISRRRVDALEVQLAAREREVEERVSTYELLKLELADAEETLVQAQMDLEVARAGAEQKKRFEAKLEETKARLKTAEASCESLSRTCEEMAAETRALKEGLRESTTGRELVELRDKLREVEDARATASRLQTEAEADCAKVRSQQERLQKNLDALLQRCQEAEQRAEAASDAKIEDDREVLRGIIERQKTEMSDRHAELVRLRRARLALRLAYAVVGLVSLVVVAIGVKFVQHAL